MAVKLWVDKETYEKLIDKNNKLVVFETAGKPPVCINLTNKKEDKKYDRIDMDNKK